MSDKEKGHDKHKNADALNDVFAAWRVATKEVAPEPALLEAIVRAAQDESSPSPFAVALWSVGRPAVLGLALGAALLVFAASRSWRSLEDRAVVHLASVGP
jgi:hypothetical protein